MAEPPPWGTPGSGTPVAFEPALAPAAEQRPTEAGERLFYLIVEQNTGSGESTVWRVEPPPMPIGHNREEARAAAHQLALTMRPKHPLSQGTRNVFQLEGDTLLVIVQGAMRTYHFKISIAEQVA